MPETPKLRLLRDRPLCIMCGRPGEAAEIAKAFGIENNRITGDEVMKVNNAYTFYTGSFKLKSGEDLPYYITSSLRQGIQSFTVCASVLFSILRPRYVIHAGICAGYNDPKEKLKLTDVIFGEAATNYQEGKMVYKDNQWVMMPDYNRVPYDAGDMQAFAEAISRPTYHYGEYLSGASVRTDAKHIFEKIHLTVNRNAIALDMEASAFLELCKHFEGDQVISLGVVKGISDYGDPNKGEVPNAKEDALANTAKALEEWVTHRIHKITWTVDESEEPGAKIVPGYYNNFIRRVLDNYLQGWEVTDKADRDLKIPHSKIRGFKTVLPRANDPNFVQEIGPVESLAREYGVTQVDIGGSTAGRYLHYKGGYLMDFARCVNSLRSCDDGEHQVGVFSRLLSKEPYYNGSADSPALASVVSWEETVKWLKKLKHEESKETETRTAKAEERIGDSEKPKSDVAEDKVPHKENDREGRTLHQDDDQRNTVLGRNRHESPAPIGEASASDGTLPEKTTQKRNASAPAHSKRDVGGEEMRSTTQSPGRPRSKDTHGKKKPPPPPPKRPMSSLPQRLRSNPPSHPPVPQATAPSWSG